MTNQRVRVRFAPSPTGPLHVGGVRTALYNYLFAKKNGGDFLLRIEDTDQTRFVPGAEEYILQSLQWAGIMPTEGVGVGGPHAPYRQSERKAIYKEYVDALVSKGFAYYAFDTADELTVLRKSFEAKKETFFYNFQIRKTLKNSLTLSDSETKELLDSGSPYVIRILIPENEEVIVTDLIRGTVKVQSSQLDDKVLFKSDGMPTYHLANVVDDHLMEITHVIRGEEWLPSAPLHVLLYRYLGWENEMPQFAHLPLLLKPDGNGKLSKRDGDRLGFPVFPLQWTDPDKGEISSGYRESGYLPDAFINMLALLGWNSGTNQELFSLDELIHEFSLERVGKSGSKFDPEKSKWFNHQYIQLKSNEELLNHFVKILETKGVFGNNEFLLKIINLIKNRVHLLPDLWEQSSFFFNAPTNFDEKDVKDKWKTDSNATMDEIKNLISFSHSIGAIELKQNVFDYIEKQQLKMSQVMNALRICIVGSSTGPDLFESIEVLGKEETIKRISFAQSILK